MTTLTQRDLADELQTLEWRMQRGRRLALLLTVIPAALGILLIGAAAVVAARSASKAQSYERRAVVAQQQAAQVEAEVRALENEAITARTALAASQEALNASRLASRAIAINLFHRGEYRQAIRAYDEALQHDPGNAYVLNLKGYAQFKMNDLKAAESTLKEATQVDLDYTWGYFDLARVQCASRDFANAKQSALSALKSDAVRLEMAKDGEFRRLCRPILDDLGVD